IVELSTGQFLAAREHFEGAVELFGPGSSRNEEAYFAQNAQGMLACTLLILGYPLTSLRKADELLAAARRNSDPNAIAINLFGYCFLHLLLRDTSLVAERADQLTSIAAEWGMAFLLIAAMFFRAWATAAVGRSEQGLAQMGQSISDPMFAEAGSTAHMLVVLAE